MAFRFQRRIKIAPGLRLNISKGGVSVSAGPRGASVTAGKRGLFASVGLPGTGLSYRQRLFASDNSHQSNIRAASTQTTTVRFTADEDGNCSLIRADGSLLSDAEVKIVRRQHGDTIRQALEELCNSRNELLAELGQFHLSTPEPTTAPQYERQPFPSAQPHLTTVQKVLALIWPPFNRRQEQLHQQWRQGNQAWEAAEQHRHETETRLVFTSTTAIEETLSRYLSEIDWPKSPDISFDLGTNISTIALDLQLPNEDEMPDKEWTLPTRQYRLTPKALSATKRRQLYRDYVHAIAFRVVGEVFARLPTIEFVSISGYRERTNPATGGLEDEYILSALTTRKRWSEIELSKLRSIEPTESMQLFELRRNMTGTGVFKPIVPFAAGELEAFQSSQSNAV
ncbi:DUF4236 domain-containing protein [Pseudomonas sp. MBLB4136]|uniref:DUF4236 domain-containing protein n=1 Tax=Pseudomonas sp. MBLB4136 TaxID=3451558 RepID=UPI003F750B1D